jgi:hypothetical protein
VRSAHAASCPDDRRDAAAQIAQSLEVDLLTFSYLDDGVLADLAAARSGNASRGDVGQFHEALTPACQALFLQPQLRLLTTAGGLNPRRCAQHAARVLCDHGCGELPIAMIYGDDLMERLEELTLAGCPLDERETGAQFRKLTSPPIFARAWLGAAGTVEALGEGARLVVAGCVAPPVLTAAAAIHAHGWTSDVFDRVAAAAVVGNCFAANSATLQALRHGDGSTKLLAEPGCLIAEIGAQGDVQLARTPGGSGMLSEMAIRADLLRPDRVPDVRINAANASVDAVPDIVNAYAIRNVGGSPPTANYDVSLGIHEGHECSMLVTWPAESLELVEFIAKRLAGRGVQLRELTCEAVAGDLQILRGWAVERATVERLAEEFNWIRHATHTGQRVPQLAIPAITPRIRTWRTEVPKPLIEHSVDCRPAHEWV